MTSSIRVALVSVAGALLVAVVVVVAAGRPPVFIASPAASTTTSSFQSGLFTSGDASVSKKPDTAFLYAAVDSQQSTASGAQSDLANKAAKLIARVKALGVADKDLNTSGYAVGPVYTPSGQTVSGYRASEQLQITWHDVNTVGKALDAIVQEGGATNVGASFGLSDPKAAQAEARTLAIADARSRAQAMAMAGFPAGAGGHGDGCVDDRVGVSRLSDLPDDHGPGGDRRRDHFDRCDFQRVDRIVPARGAGRHTFAHAVPFGYGGRFEEVLRRPAGFGGPEHPPGALSDRCGPCSAGGGAAAFSGAAGLRGVALAGYAGDGGGAGFCADCFHDGAGGAGASGAGLSGRFDAQLPAADVGFRGSCRGHRGAAVRPAG